MSTSKYIIGWLAAGLLLVSCDKKAQTFDITGDAQVKFFMNIQAPGNAPQNSFSYSAINIPDVASSGLLNLSTTVPATIKFPVFSSAPVSQDVMIVATQDNTLVNLYNAAHNTSFLEAPANLFNTISLSANILKGQSISADSITITTNLPALNTLTGTAYMAPIKLTGVSDPTVGGITSNTASNIAYIIINVEQRKIKFLATTADVQGALLTPRTAWTSIFNPALTTIGSIFDASLTTFSRWTASPGQVDVNLQAVKNVTGIRLYSANVATYVPTRVDVYLSNDGVNFSLIGSPLKANLTYATSYNYILFYKAIPAQYIRLILSYTTSTNTQNYRVVEFDVYAN